MADSLTYAGLTSNVLSAPIVSSIFSILAPSFLGYQNILTKIVLIVIGITIYAILPFTPTFLRIAKGNKDIFISKLEERPRGFIVGMLVYIINFLAFIVIGFIYYAIFSLTSLIVAFLTLAITLKWKVSIHMIGFCTSLTILTIISNGLFIYAFALVPILIWVRVRTKAHSWTQVVIGTILGIVVTYYTMTSLIGLFF